MCVEDVLKAESYKRSRDLSSWMRFGLRIFVTFLDKEMW
jgi:hypothetical protein